MCHVLTNLLNIFIIINGEFIFNCWRTKELTGRGLLDSNYIYIYIQIYSEWR